jgi:hypothetical protein
VCGNAGGRLRFVFSGFSGGSFFEFIGHFPFVDAEFQLALLGLQHDRLALHSADEVKRGLRLPPQGHFQEVVLDARLDGFLHFSGHFKEAVGGAQAPDALVRSPVVVIPHPEFQPLPRRLERVELGSD